MADFTDATRNQEFSVWYRNLWWLFWGILGTQEISPEHLSIDLSAPTLSGTNTNYTLRMMATYASGTSNSGVVRAISREAQEYLMGKPWWYPFFASVIESRWQTLN
jgi:hypothetical protein